MNHNISAEQSVIGSVLLEGSLFSDLSIRSDNFVDVSHQKIFAAMQRVAEQEKAIDVVTVVTELGDDIEGVGGVSYLTDLANSIPSTESLKHYESAVFESYRRRKTREIAIKYAENPSDESLHEFIGSLETVREIGVKKQEKTTHDYLLEIAEDMSLPPEQSEKGFKTGFSDLDRMTGGLQPGDLIIVAARPSVGKTAFALNMAAGHCENEGTSHVFSLEMGTKSLLQRMISSQGNIDGQKWRSMAFSTEDYERAMNAIGILSNWHLNIHDQVRTINEIRPIIRQAVKEDPEGNHLVVIDYLQLMQSTGRYERRDLEVGAMTRELKLLAIELDIPIVLLSQLSRAVEQRQDKRPMMSDLRESGNIEQDADVVGFLYRDDYYDAETEQQNIIEIILSKQRNGPTGTVELAFLKEYGRFVNLDYRYSGGGQNEPVGATSY